MSKIFKIPHKKKAVITKCQQKFYDKYAKDELFIPLYENIFDETTSLFFSTIHVHLNLTQLNISQ